MAKKPSMYHEQYFADERAFESPAEESPLLNQTPWWAISVAIHAIVLLMIWSIVLSKSVEGANRVIDTGIEDADYIEPPRIPPPPIKEVPTIIPVEEPDPDETIERDEPSPVIDEARRPTQNPSKVEGPYPEKGYNSSFGLGGDIGGGPGGGGSPGGFHFRKGDRDIPDTDKNVFHALYWLRDHQNLDAGNWSADNFIEQCRSNGPILTDKVRFKREGVCSNKTVILTLDGRWELTALPAWQHSLFLVRVTLIKTVNSN